MKGYSIYNSGVVKNYGVCVGMRTPFLCAIDEKRC